jgi:molybdopterin molybdotransferase
MAEVVSGLPAGMLAKVLDVPRNPEGWILGLGHEKEFMQAANAMYAPPPLKNDCFAMPQGAHWTPVTEALEHLRTHLSIATETETCALSDAADRYAAQDISAARTHPPAPNAAVDGYGFAGPAVLGLNRFTLVQGRSAAGAPFEGKVREGQAIRILTGANLPNGVDTVVLQEDVRVSRSELSFHGPLKQGANARAAGEDMLLGQVILPRGRRITAGDIGMVAAAGVGALPVYKRLRVGVLSTGDELIAAGEPADDGQIYDANGPMLSALINGWGFDLIDLGRAPDDRPKLRQMLDDGAARCDAILTSGGASAGAEDHMSALLQDTGSFALWRIAMKPGRPLALGLWDGTPVFGLPGNPVAAMVCALIFARPALRQMAGGAWAEPETYMVPAAFNKSKKAGRREYLRARMSNGQIDIFASEGSGRVSGLHWATGLVELGEDAQEITHGHLVRYIPFSSLTT